VTISRVEAGASTSSWPALAKKISCEIDHILMKYASLSGERSVHLGLCATDKSEGCDGDGLAKLVSS